MVSETFGASAKHILVVHGEESVRSFISQALREAGYRVWAVEDAMQALKSVESSRETSERVDLILT